VLALEPGDLLAQRAPRGPLVGERRDGADLDRGHHGAIEGSVSPASWP
jgi:hypothetical protein